MTALAARLAAIRQLPEGYRQRPMREQLQVLLDMGLSPLDARMAVVPRLMLRATDELTSIWQQPAGAYRVECERECQAFWREFWATLNFHLEGAAHPAAADLIDKAIARVEPFNGGRQ